MSLLYIIYSSLVHHVLHFSLILFLAKPILHIDKVPNSEGTPAYTLIATQTPAPDPNSRTPVPDFTAIVLNLIRLEKESTDVLITINVPHIRGEYSEEEVDLQLGMQGKLISDAVDYSAKIWETFKIKHWGLFNEV
jgi:hypothetical protein